MPNSIDIRCNSITGDLNIINGDLDLVSGPDELQQLLLTELRWFFGEYVFDTSKGVPYFENILVKNPDVSNIENILKTVISETVGVNKITAFRFEYSAAQRFASLSFEVESVYGTISVSSIPLGA